jgi:hypothetical protein
MRKAAVAAGLLPVLMLMTGCATGRSCPQYQVASDVTVDGTAFVAAHPQAGMLCVARNGCVWVGPRARHPAVIFIPVSAPGVLHVQVTVTAGTGSVLLDAATRVTVHHAVFSAACGIAADLGTVTIARDGALRAR